MKKIENNLENKVKFVAQYYGQRVLKNRLHERGPAKVGFIGELPQLYLELKDIKDLTEEDARELDLIFLGEDELDVESDQERFEDWVVWLGNNMDVVGEGDPLPFEVVDELRRLG